MSSKLWDANPLLVALFDLPTGVQAFSNAEAQPSVRSVNRLRSSQGNGTDTDNTSLLHGESISLADEDYSDAVDQVKPPSSRTPLLFNSYFPSYGPSFAKLPSHRTVGKAASHKKKKKRRPDTAQSSNKVGGRKSERAFTFSSYGGTESPISSTTSDTPSYDVGDNVQQPNIARQHDDDELLSLDRVTNLKLKIQRIRLSILSMENDLIATRHELVRAHKQLNFATMELDGIKRSAFEAEFGLFQLAQHQERTSTSQSALRTRLSPMHFFDTDNMSAMSSVCSTSTDRMHYLTPSSTIDGDESINSTPRSTGSYESFYSLNEVDNTKPRNLQVHARTSYEDKDKTPLKKNTKLKQVVMTDTTVNTGKESSSIDTPSTMASSLSQSADGVPRKLSEKEEGRRDETICRHDSFIRAHDLTLSEGVDSSSIVSLQAIDVGDIANALFQKGYDCAMDESDRWTPEQGTGKILSKRATDLLDGSIGNWPNAAHGDEVLVWTSKCIHGGHGSEYPLVKARGLIPTSALKMVQLLLDSERVKEYNKMSLGRIDEHCFAIGVERLTECPSTGILGELKIVRSKSQPPVVRKPIELRLLLHARRLSSDGNDDDKTSNYLTIGRSLWETEQGTANIDESSVTRCEMLLSVNLIRDLPPTSFSCNSNNQCCEITTITHGISPGIPISIGKRIGLAAAAKYIRDIRAVFEK